MRYFKGISVVFLSLLIVLGLSIKVFASTNNVTNDAVIVSDTIPTNMVAGESYNVTITMKNTGTNVWSESTMHRLGSRMFKNEPFYSTLVDGYPRILLANNQSVNPGDTVTFNLVLKAPVNPGSYATSWQMVQEGVQWFGQTLTKNINVVQGVNDAQIISDTIPTNMVSGENYNVSVTIKNTGSKTWSESTKHRLGSRMFKNELFYSTLLDNYPRVLLPNNQTVAPGQTITLNYILTAPANIGTYTTSWQMVQDGVQWFGPALSKDISVGNGINDAEIVSDNIPTNMVAGNSYNVSITMKNTGTKTWSEATKYRLGSRMFNNEPFYDTLVDNYPRVLLSNNQTVAPGQSVSINLTLKAPKKAGTYTTSWQMVQDGVQWFGPALTKNITIDKNLNDAEIMSDNIPTSMIAGEKYNVSIILKNTGVQTWSKSNNFRLGSRMFNNELFYDTLVDDYPRVLLADGQTVAPGETVALNLTLKAPVNQGTYTTSWQMLQEGVEWFGQALSKSIYVDKGINNDEIISDTIPTNMIAGEVYNVSITYKNTGNKTWSADTMYRLGSQMFNNEPFYYIKVDNYPRVLLDSNQSVAPGQTVTIKFTLKAPWNAGTYTTSWQMVQEGKEWFGQTVTKSVTVQKNGYEQYINMLKAAHPNWIFEFYDAGISLIDYINKQWSLNNPTPKTDLTTFKETDQNIISARQQYGITDGPSFYLSNESGVEFFANPLHFLNDGNVGYGTSDSLYYDDNGIYQFMQLSFDSSYQTLDGVKSMLQGTYFDSDIDNYSRWFYDAAQSNHINPYMLVSKALIEGGASNKANPSTLLTGYIYNNTKVYNFFGIGCTDGNSLAGGACYAYNNGWVSPKDAIYGGAAFVSNGYITNGQDTFYTFRYNLPDYIKTGQIMHQYASNIADAWAKGNALAKLKSVLDSQSIKFKIPLFR